MRARQTLDKHDFSSKNERKERKKIKKKKRKSFHAGPGTGLISSSIVSDDGDGVVCGVCRKWPNLQRIPIYLSSHLSALCDGAIDLIRFPYGIGSPKHIVFVWRICTFTFGYCWSVQSPRKKSFFYHFWFLAGVWLRWLRLHGVGMHLVPVRTTYAHTNERGSVGINMRRQKNYCTLSGILWNSLAFLRMLCNLCVSVYNRVRGVRDFFGRSIGCSLCTRAHMMYELRHQHTHKHTLPNNKNGHNSKRWMDFHGHPTANTHTQIRALLVEIWSKSNRKNPSARRWRPFESPIKINYNTK